MLHVHLISSHTKYTTTNYIYNINNTRIANKLMLLQKHGKVAPSLTNICQNLQHKRFKPSGINDSKDDKIDKLRTRVQT